MMSPSSSTPTPDTPTRERIILAARELIAKNGAKATSMRAVAREADVDVALISHYFGNKEGLFTAALQSPINPQHVLKVLKTTPLESLGTALVRALLETFDQADTTQIRLFINTLVSSPEKAMDLFEAIPLPNLRLRLKESDHAELRASLVISQVSGLILGRYLFCYRGLTETPREDLALTIGHTVQNYLTGSLPGN